MQPLHITYGKTFENEVRLNGDTTLMKLNWKFNFFCNNNRVMRSQTNIEGICSSAITELPCHKWNFREHGYKAVSKKNSKIYNLNNSWDMTSLLWQISKLFRETIKLTIFFHKSCVVWIYVFFTNLWFFPLQILFVYFLICFYKMKFS